MDDAIQHHNKKMVLYMFCHYAQQPPYNTAVRYHNWGKLLAAQGYSVTIICASFVHNTDIDVIDELNGVTASECEGIQYLYVRTRKYRGNGIARIQNMWQYYYAIKGIARKMKKPDICLCCGAYLVNRVSSIWSSVPCICDIEDLWPEGIVDVMKVSKRNPIIKILYANEKSAYEKCDALIFSVAGGYDYIKSHGWQNSINRDKVFYINMGVDLEEFDRNRENVKYEDPELLREDTFKVIYCGSVRDANNVRSICDAAAKLLQQGHEDIHFMIHGSGTQVEELVDYCKTKGINNVKFYGRINKNQIPYVLSHADICFLSFADTPIKKYGGSQQKSFEYYASCKPIVSNWNSGYNLITEYGCGLVTKTQDADDVAHAILQIYHTSVEKRLNMGTNARKIAEDYCQPILVDKLKKVFEYVCKDKSLEYQTNTET